LQSRVFLNIAYTYKFPQIFVAILLVNKDIHFLIFKINFKISKEEEEINQSIPKQNKIIISTLTQKQKLLTNIIFRMSYRASSLSLSLSLVSYQELILIYKYILQQKKQKKIN
jgi:hypothetical protein